MKKAKIVLTAIAVLATLGGALAMKAKARFNGVTYYTTSLISHVATATLLNAKTTVAAAGVYRYYTLIQSKTATVGKFVTTTSI